LNFFRQIFRNTQLSNFIKIRPVGAKLYLTDGWTEASSCILQFCRWA